MQAEQPIGVTKWGVNCFLSVLKSNIEGIMPLSLPMAAGAWLSHSALFEQIKLLDMPAC